MFAVFASGSRSRMREINILIFIDELEQLMVNL